MPKDMSKKIDEFENKKDKYRMKNKNSEDRNAYQRVFDSRTVNLLEFLLRNNYISKLVGIISQGKEANIYFAYGHNYEPIAIKIYKIDIQSAKWMRKYIKGDPRFKKIGNSIDKLVFTWCNKEFKNLQKIYHSGINCPKPIFSKGNILLMSYIGEKNGNPAPLLKDSLRKIKDIELEMQISLSLVKNLYKKAKLVHGDLSEFNILYYMNKQYLIDVSQSISIQHPHALPYLVRDIKNIINFYKKLGLKTPNPKEIFNEILA